MTSDGMLVVITALLLIWSVQLWLWRATIIRYWAEPVLRRPVLTIESDDWGPGPEWHAERLQRIADLLTRHRDIDNRPALITLGVVLGAPDTSAMAKNNLAEYRRITLDDARCQPLLEQMKSGERDGVFALQLHGMEHYWPPAMLRAAQQDGAVRAWLTTSEFPHYEVLPSALQSRWVNGSHLPSQPLPAEEIVQAVKEETAAFGQVFQRSPSVAVPPTFVWNRVVEQGWLMAGVKVIITPGRRYTARDAVGQPAVVDATMYNGQRAGKQACYLVRDIYFEPQLGHDPERVLDDAAQRFRLGRPALLETHRSNFIGNEDECRQSLDQLERLLDAALQRWPGLAFLSPEALGRIYSERPSEWCVNDFATRLHLLLRRLGMVSRLRKLALLTGLALPAVLLRAVTAPVARHEGVML